jgi:RNA polymerase sigma factor (sigma-70 family)
LRAGPAAQRRIGGVKTVAVGDLVSRARDGDERAWDDLVGRYLRMVHAICRGHRLGDEDAADVNQVVWLRLVEHLDRIRTPDAVGGWIAATTRNECLRVLRTSGRVVPTAEASLDGIDVRDAGIDTGLLVYERDRALMTAFGRMGQRCQQLLRLLMTDPAPAYDEIAAALDIPVGSIGPTRGRCLEQLRHLLG